MHDENLFSDNVERSSKHLWKMVSADVKANVKQNEIKELLVYLTNFYKRYLQNLKCSVKSACIFHLILVGIASSLIFSIKNSGDGGKVFCLTEKIN